MTGADMTVSSDWHFPVLLEFSLVVCMFFFFFPHMRLKCKKKKVVVNHFLVPDWTLSSLCHTCTHRKSSSALFALLSKHKTLADPAPNPLQLCPREVKPKPERGELSQLLNLSTHSQHYPLKINHAGKPLSQTLASYVSTHAPRSAGSSLETSPPLFQEADVRMAAIRHDAPLGNVETITLPKARYGGVVRCSHPQVGFRMTQR